MAYRRAIDLRAEKGDDGKLRILASTDAAIDFGGWREILEHDGAEIDISAARSLLLNHDPNQLVGSASEYRIEGGEQWCSASILEGSRLQTGPLVQDAVDSGALRGVSISYDYNANSDDVQVDEQSRTIRVKKWRLLEVSLTPIPADKACAVRSYPITNARMGEDGGPSMELEDEKAKSGGSEADDTKRAEDMPQDEAKEERQDEAVEERQDEAVEERAEGCDKREEGEEDEAKGGEERSSMLLKLRGHADTYGLTGITNDTFKDCQTEQDGMAIILKRQKEMAMERHQEPVAPVSAAVTVDEGDKFIRSVGAGMLRSLNIEADGEFANAGELHLPATEIIRRCAKFDGQQDTESMNPMELANYALRRMSYNGKRDSSSANKIGASFSTLTGNIANKAILAGFNNYTPIYDQIATVKSAANFNEHPHVAAAIGRMQETPEGEAFPESNQREGTYNSQLAMWGHTLSITEQALVNDELGEIMRSFMRTGYSAGRTIDRRVFEVLLNGTWTNDTTTGADLGTTGNLDKVRNDLKSKLSPAGEKMENDPAILLVDSTNRYNADAATGQLYGVSTGANEQTGSNAVRGVRVIDSTWVGDTSLFGSALSTDYYLMSDPMLVDTICVEFLRGMRTPQVMPFDAGAVAAAKFKVYLPFQATLATHADSDGLARVTGIQKATVA